MRYSYKDLEHLHNGSSFKAKKVGVPELDNHIVFKKNVTIVVGHSNVGKTTGLLFILFIWALRHPDELKFALMLNENDNDEMVAQLVEWYNGKFIDDKNHSKKEIEEALEFINERFLFVDYNIDKTPTIESALNNLYFIKNGLKGYEKFDFDCILLDPYNSFYTKGYLEHYANATLFRKAVKKLDAKVIITMHTNTEAQRARDDNGRTKVPHLSNVEYGSMFSNRSDDSIVIHRQIQSENDKYKTEIHVQEIKHVRSGGQPTAFNSPIVIEWIESLAGRFVFETSGDVVTKNKQIEFKY